METYVERALGTYASRASFHSGHIMCRCKICGDSERNKSKRRGYILKRNPKGDGEWIYYCHNDDCDANSGIRVTTWLKKEFPALYEDYRKENFLAMRKENTIIKEKPIVQEPYLEINDTKHFIPILTGTTELFKTAIQYCMERKIPNDIWKHWFVAIDGRYQGRMIIPFFDSKGMIYYYQCRTLIGQEPKYLNRKSDNGEKEIYNIFHVDRTKPIMVTEGPIDSMFLENAIATLGVKFTKKVQAVLDTLNCHYVLDNDEAGRKVSKKFLDNGMSVFNWKKFLKDNNVDAPIKDVNDFVKYKDINKLSFQDLEKYFTKSNYDKVWFV